jgi:DNA-directed RNA polymerase specialized sigma24 family protein
LLQPPGGARLAGRLRAAGTAFGQVRGSALLFVVRQQAVGPAAEAHEQLADLRRAVLALPPALRLMVTLRYNEELSYEQIGQLLHLPPATVGTSLLRARRRLRAALEDSIEADDDSTP